MEKKYKLVIVESPSKSKTIAGYLGSEYKVTASKGHIKDLPKKKFAINLETFEAEIVPMDDKASTIKDIIDLAKNASEIYIASDDDREGETISFHIREILKRDDVHRVVFNAVTKDAIKKAIANPKGFNDKLHEAQHARRLLDRIIGYKLSPILWDKLQSGTSAGRVQSVALKLIVKREEEILNFKPETWFDLFADFEKDSIKFQAKFHGMSIDKAYKIKEMTEVNKILEEIKDKPFSLVDMFSKERQTVAPAPYTTSKLQQEAYKKLGMDSKNAMLIAQNLYEGVDVAGYGRTGLITYMRTDSVRTEPAALESLRNYISSELGSEYLSKEPIVHKSKKSNSKVQDAHEAIRPASLAFPPDQIKSSLSLEQYDLYKLIWNKFMASQMANAIDDVTTIVLKNESYLFKSVGSVERFEGFRKIAKDMKEAKTDDEESKVLPKMEKGETILPSKPAFFMKKETKPPPRFDEASFGKELEDKGIGRPSTYAAIKSTIMNRNYVAKNTEGRYFPQELGKKLCAILEEYFPKQMDIAFTSKTEQDLDDIEEGTLAYVEFLKGFWAELEKEIVKANEALPSIAREYKGNEANKTDIKCTACENGFYIIKKGTKEDFLGCSNYPTCKSTKNFEKDKKTGKITIVSGFKKVYTADKCNTCSKRMTLIKTKTGEFLACEDSPTCKFTSPVPSKLHCPKCKVGKLVERQTKTGKIFVGCYRYPACDLTIWDEIIQKKCKDCAHQFLIRDRNDKKICYACKKEQK